MPSDIKLLNIDCMKAMVNIPDKFFDLAIVDPPYFEESKSDFFAGSDISTCGIKRNNFSNKKLKNWDIPDQKYFDNLVRISKNQIIWGINHFDCKFIARGRIVWDKKNDSSSFSHCDIALCSLHYGNRIFRYMWNGMIQEKSGQYKENRIHPTQKPVALYKWILKKYAVEGNQILDTHLGSGSIAIACYDMGFNLTGFEIDKEYYDLAVNRLENHKKQITFI